MINPILIHNDNVSESVKQKFESQNIIDFDYLNSEFNKLDNYISKVVIQDLKIKDFNIIFIKDNLSSNYLELYGIRVAYHIRLSQELDEKKRFAPIVLLSDLDAYSLNKLEPMTRITFTKNIYVEPNSLLTIEKYKNKTFSEFNKVNYKKDFLNLINIESPENSTNHSIANEWAIYKWAKELNITNSVSINNTIAKISNQLYFKYLQQLNQIEDDINILEEKKQIKFSTNLKIVKQKATSEKKIMIIDDELNKGWGDIFEEYFKKKRNFVITKNLPFEFGNNQYVNLKENIINFIADEKPDLIILDMRLVYADHKKETKPEDISGIKLLNKIKSTSLYTKLNPGIQVIMLSATTRSDILEQAYKENKIVGYIQKDHMENRFFSTKENINKLTDNLMEAEKKFYLKEIWTIQQSILILDIFKKDKYNSIQSEIEFIFELLNSSMENSFKFTMLTLYKVLEILKDLYVNESAKYEESENEIKAICLVNEKYSSIEKSKLLQSPEKYGFINAKNKTAEQNAKKYYYSTTNKLCSIMFEKLNFTQEKNLYRSIIDISDKRNNYIHPTKRKNIKIDANDIINWFEMLKIILNEINNKESK